MKILLDTCTILWAVSQPEKITPEACELILREDSQVCVSAISCAEIAMASERGRIELDRHWKIWFRHYISVNDWKCFAINLQIIEETYSLPEPFHRDPADRIIVATARIHSCNLITADKKILEFPHVNTTW